MVAVSAFVHSFGHLAYYCISLKGDPMLQCSKRTNTNLVEQLMLTTFSAECHHRNHDVSAAKYKNPLRKKLPIAIVGFSNMALPLVDQESCPLDGLLSAFSVC